MINGDTILKKVQAPDNDLSRWMAGGWTDDRMVETIYERAYARPPSEKERAVVRDFIQDQQSTGSSHRRALEGVLWTVLNSKEFQVNH